MEDRILHLDEYQQEAMRTNPSTDFQKNLLNGALGLCGESGEVADIIKKWTNQGHGLDPEQVIEEIGDVMWYCALIAHSLDYTLSEVATENIHKLKLRYPYGFDPNKSIHRK